MGSYNLIERGGSQTEQISIKVIWKDNSLEALLLMKLRLGRDKIRSGYCSRLQAIFKEIVLLVIFKEMAVKSNFLFLLSNWYIAEREPSMEHEPDIPL